MTPAFITGSTLIGPWFAELERGEPPKRFALTSPFASLDIRPGRMMLFGGPPGGGKTAALMQIGIDLLRMNDAARLLVANVEMSPVLLFERVASRVSGVPLTAIADRTLTTDERERVRVAVASLEPIAARLAFLNAPYTLEHVVSAGMAFGANAMILDYIQRFTVGNEAKTQREQIDNAVSVLRRICDAGAVVLVAAAVSRQKGNTGSTYSGLNLASFRGSSELEFGCDSATLLIDDGEGGITFQCEKNRFGAATDIRTAFDPTRQTFAPHVELSGLANFDDATTAKPARATRKPKGDRP